MIENNLIMITGCSGSLGSQLTKRFLDSNFRVEGTRFNSTCSNNHVKHNCRRENLLDLNCNYHFLKRKPEILVLTSWITTPGEYLNSEDNYLWAQASKRIIDYFLAQGGKYVVVIGSCAEYQAGQDKPLSEDSVEMANSKYSESKLELLHWLQDKNIKYLWPRVFYQYDLKRMDDKFISQLAKAIKFRTEFEVLHSKNIFDFISVNDAAAVIHLLIQKGAQGVFNVGTGRGIKIIDLLHNLSGNLNLPKELWKIEESHESKKIVADIKKLREVIGNFEFTAIENALALYTT